MALLLMLLVLMRIMLTRSEKHHILIKPISSIASTSSIHAALPSCWGNPKDVGPCIYDYQRHSIPKILYTPGLKNESNGRWIIKHTDPIRTIIRILYLCSRQDYLHRAYRFFYDEVEAASKLSDLDVRLWGPGWFGYDLSLPLQDNIEKAYGNADFFQIIYTSANRPPPMNVPSAVIVYSLGDCHEKRCVEEIHPNMDVLAFRYAFEPMDYFRYDQIQSYISSTYFIEEMAEMARTKWFPLIYHSNECTLERLFYPSTPALGESWHDSRPHDVRLFGQAVYPFYPLRYKVKQGMKDGTIRGEPVKLTQWWLDPKHEDEPQAQSASTLGKYITMDPAVEHVASTAQEWGDLMRTTKICVFDSSLERKTIRKFNEAFLSGCVVASDIPSEMESLFKNVVIKLDASMSPLEIDTILARALENPKELAEMAIEAFKRARVYFSCVNKVDKLLEAAARFMTGERGYWFPHGYSATCRSYSNGGPDIEQSQPPWCV